LISYVDLSTRSGFQNRVNPFDDTSKVLTAYVDIDSFDDDFVKKLLFNLDDGLNVQLISQSELTKRSIVFEAERNNCLIYREDVDNTTRYVGVAGIAQIRGLSLQLQSFGTSEEVAEAIKLSRLAEATGASLLITENKILLNNPDKSIINRVAALSLGDAVATLGLLLRSREVYEIRLSSFGDVSYSFKHSKWDFFWAASRQLIYSGWALVSSASQLDSIYGRDLSLTLLARISSTLKCRDAIQTNVLRSQSNNSVEESIFYFEYFLINATAAFDNLARIVDTVYRPTDKSGKRFKRSNISWRSGWFQALKSQYPDIAGVMEGGGKGRDVLEFTATLRNYIHEDGMRGAMHTSNGKPAAILIDLPRSSVKSVRPIIDRLWNQSKGLGYPDNETLMLSINFVVENLTADIVQVVNSIVREIDFGAVEGFKSEDVKSEEPNDWYAKGHNKEILALIGLDTERSTY